MQWELARLALQAARRTWSVKTLQNRGRNPKKSIPKNNLFSASISERFGRRFGRVSGSFCGRFSIGLRSDKRTLLSCSWYNKTIVFVRFWALRRRSARSRKPPKSVKNQWQSACWTGIRSGRHFERILSQFRDAKILDFWSFSLFFSMSDYHCYLVAQKLENRPDNASRQFCRNLPGGLLGEDLGEG